MNAESKDVVEHKPDPFIEMVERLATNPDVDPDKMQKIVDMQAQILDRNAKTEFYDSMNRVQEKLPTVLPDLHNQQTNSDYASLNAILAAIRPVYTAEGFSASFSQGKADTEGYIRIEGALRHRQGHSEPYGLELPADKTGIKGNVNKTDIHAAASTFKYGCRYLTCMMFHVSVGPDLDGNQPVETISEEQAADLTALVDEIGLTPTRQKAFLKWAKIETIEELPLEDFAFACKHLKKIGAEA